MISIRVADNAENSVVSVIDQGEGIPAEDIPYIWDRFYKAHVETGKHKGSGLGLAIVKSILEAHDAKYGVESEMGKGSRFWFEIKKGANYSAK